MWAGYYFKQKNVNICNCILIDLTLVAPKRDSVKICSFSASTLFTAEVKNEPDLWPLSPNSPWWGCVPRWRGQRGLRRPPEREPPCRSPERPGETGCAWSASIEPPHRTSGNKTRRNLRRRPPCSGSASLRSAPAGPAVNPSETESPQAPPEAPLTCRSNAGNAPLRLGLVL